LEHPFIAEFFQVREDPAHFFLIMEYVEHGNLLDYVNDNGPLTEDQARRYFSQLISVLDYLHNEKRVAHRDLKCENVLLDRYNNIRVIDFGLSNMFSEAAPNLQTACGSPAYAAPEMVMGSAYTQSADVWSAGILLYSIVVGYLPFDDENVQTLLRQIVYSEVEYPRHLSPQLVDLLRKMICKDPRTRISSAMIKNHPWFSQTEYRAMEEESRIGYNLFGSDQGRPTIRINPDIITQMTALGIDCKELSQSLLLGEFTEVTALYRVFRREKLCERNRDLFHRVAVAASAIQHPVHMNMNLCQATPLGAERANPNASSMKAVRVQADAMPSGQSAANRPRRLTAPTGQPVGARRLSRPTVARKPVMPGATGVSHETP
jgi:serine/threonine protein kinase